jgi:phage gpG-like protein
MNIRLERVLDAFDAVRGKLADKTSMLRGIGMFVSGEVEENFRQRGRPRWAGNRPLVRTGRMKSEAVRMRTQGNLVHIGETLDSIPYANFIHDGTKKMPARPFMVIPKLVAGLKSFVKEHILGGTK